MISSAALIVGVDGSIGSSLINFLLPKYKVIYATTRRSLHRKNLFKFDLSDDFDEIKKIASLCDIAFICAGTGGLVECEIDSAGTYAVNVISTVKLVSLLKGLGLFVVWLSSNAVFSGMHPFSKSDEPYMPINEYGRQKVAAEKEIIALGERVGIVRLTKVLTRTTPLINSWAKSLMAGNKISPWEDCYLSPVSLKYAINAIALIGYVRKSGISHVSGSDDISYAYFARMLAIKLCGNDDLVKPISRPVKQSSMLVGRHSSLDMGQTVINLGIKPQPPAEVLADIYS